LGLSKSALGVLFYLRSPLASVLWYNEYLPRSIRTFGYLARELLLLGISIQLSLSFVVTSVILFVIFLFYSALETVARNL